MKISDTLVTNLTKGISNYISENPHRHMIRIMADFINLDVTIVNDDFNLLDGEIIAVEDEEGLYLTIGRFPSDREMLIAFLERLKKYHKEDYQKIIENFCNNKSSNECVVRYIVNSEEEMNNLTDLQNGDCILRNDLSKCFTFDKGKFIQLHTSTIPSMPSINTLTCYSEEDLKYLTPQDGDACYVSKSNKLYVFNDNRWERILDINDSDIVITDHNEHNEIKHLNLFKIMSICFAISVSVNIVAAVIILYL